MFSYRKYTFKSQDLFTLVDASIFLKKSAILDKSSTFYLKAFFSLLIKKLRIMDLKFELRFPGCPNLAVNREDDNDLIIC